MGPSTSVTASNTRPLRNDSLSVFLNPTSSLAVMNPLKRKKELILAQETAFAQAVGKAVLAKPKVSYWMVLLPILFVYFVYRMQGFKKERATFEREFMTTRRRALDAAFEAAQRGTEPEIDELVRQSDLTEPLKKPYVSWVRTLVDYYLDLLKSNGNNFEGLVEAAYRNRTNYLLILNRLSATEREFYAALKPHLEKTTTGVADIIATIEEQSQRLRRDIAERIFP